MAIKAMIDLSKGILLSFNDTIKECEVYEERNGYSVVSYNGGFNYVKPNNKLLSKDWFWNALDFSGGYGRVQNAER